ncbi:MAG: RHS repeat-associated core domain-containing protein [Candidatus Electrothrix sp. Rat3]|nr:RHS repeat-associated core domain-containing protein [Candidatus Electrothrix rattekaaiensis]
MKPPKDVSCQGTLSSSLFCRITLLFLFFLFTLLSPLTVNSWADINITSPIVGDVWYTGETHNIQWNTDNTSSNVTIYLYKDGVRQRTITSNTPNNGSYSWTVLCCDNGNKYAVEVRTDDEYSYNSKYDYFTLAFPSTTSPGTPSSFTATAQSSTGIDLSWNAVSDVTGYDVYTCAGAFVGNTSQPSYLVTGLSPDTSYSYKVRSNSAEGSSNFTACQTATTLSTDPDSYTLSGKTKKADGTAILNATVTFTGLSSVQSIHDGEYSQTVPNGWSGEVCATRSGCDFSCVSVSNVTADTSGIDLICGQSKHKISGYTQRYNGTHIPSVTVSFSGESSVTSNSNGYYEKYVDHGWSGTISGSKLYYKFDSDTISTVTSDQPGNMVHGDYQQRTGRSASVPVRESNWSTPYSRSNSTSCSDCRKCEKSYADPIDISTGAQFLEYRLLSVQGLVPISFNLAYNSLVVDQEGIAGRAWSLNYDFAAKVVPADNEAVNVAWAENRTNRFNHDGGGLYSSLDEACLYDKLVKNSDNTYTLTRQDKTVYLFDTAGRLIELSDAQSRSLQFSYDSSERLKRIAEPVSGVFLEYAYNNEGLLQTVVDPLGREVSLSYDADRRLKTITDPDDYVLTFTWNDQDQILTGTSSEGYQLFANTFDAQGRVIAQDDGLSDNSEFTLSYDESQPDRIITTVTDRNGASTKYTFDSQYRMLEKIDELGNASAAYSYDAKGNRTQAVDANGHGSSFAYNDQGNMISVTDADGKSTGMSYDAKGYLAQLTDALGKTSSFTYDGQGRITQAVDPLGKAAAFSYNSAGQLVAVTSPLGRVVKYEYTDGLPTKVIRPEGNSETIRYDAAGRVTAVLDSEGNTTTFNHDLPCSGTSGPCRASSITDPLGNTVKITSDSRGNLLSLLDAKGNESRFEYDANGNLLRAINALGQVTAYEYDGEGRLVRLTDAKGNSSTLSYDAKGRMVALTDPLGNTRTLSYDKTRNLTAVQDAYGKVIQSLNYDNRDNPVGMTDAQGNNSGLQYDELNRLKQSTDPLGRVVQMNYDALDRLSSTVDPLGGTVAQSFNEEGQLIDITDPKGNRTSFAYDSNGRRISEISAAGSTVKYTYTARDLLAKLTNGRGQERQFSYDALGRMTAMSDPDGTTNFTYDANSNVLTVSDADGTSSREYDALDRVSKYTDSRGNVIRYAYDAVGNLSSLTYPDGKAVQYSYDAADRLVSVTDWNNRTTSYAYDKEGRLILTTRPNGSTVTRVYNEAGQLVQQKDIKAGGEVIVQYDYSYDKVGNIVEEKATPTPEPVAISPAKMTYGPANQLASYNGLAVQHDADGNMVQGPLNGKPASFVFDSRNRLRQVGSTVYTYDAENQRIAAAEGSAKTQYIVNPNASLSQVLVREDQDGTKTYYVYGIGLIGQEKNGAYRSFHYDFRGSTVAMTDEVGKITHQYVYTAYGTVNAVQEEAFNPFRYVGQYGVMYEVNGLYYMRARYYQPELRRFLGEDPIWNKNLFAYVEGNPLVGIDPSGLQQRQPSLQYEIISRSSSIVSTMRQLAGFFGWEEAKEALRLPGLGLLASKYAVILPGNDRPMEEKIYTIIGMAGEEDLRVELPLRFMLGQSPSEAMAASYATAVASQMEWDRVTPLAEACIALNHNGAPVDSYRFKKSYENCVRYRVTGDSSHYKFSEMELVALRKVYKERLNNFQDSRCFDSVRNEAIYH